MGEQHSRSGVSLQQCVSNVLERKSILYCLLVFCREDFVISELFVWAVEWSVIMWWTQFCRWKRAEIRSSTTLAVTCLRLAAAILGRMSAGMYAPTSCSFAFICLLMHIFIVAIAEAITLWILSSFCLVIVCVYVNCFDTWITDAPNYFPAFFVAVSFRTKKKKN